ncbi:hypothetical protein DWG14_01176 [Streptomyces griseorubiginosus]|uniref:Uncharacterized protein n=1 Tax=Streptomyces griseorubiginosus TaxID=67304 RepID=A0AAI8PLJ0_9ACTN|nr:hypothetical protein DWG14_01176 [Streptomyces griseorubiginosus]
MSYLFAFAKGVTADHDDTETPGTEDTAQIPGGSK